MRLKWLGCLDGSGDGGSLLCGVDFSEIFQLPGYGTLTWNFSPRHCHKRLVVRSLCAIMPRLFAPCFCGARSGRSMGK